MNRQDISRLNKNRDVFLKLGFICALSFVLFAFNYTSDFYVPNEEPINMEMIPDVQVIRTIYEKERLPPPPVVAPTTEPIIEDFEITETPIPEKLEVAIAELPKDIEVEPTAFPLPPVPDPLPMPEVKETPEEIFVAVEEMPRFPGCEEAGLSKEEKKACAEKKMLAFMTKLITLNWQEKMR